VGKLGEHAPAVHLLFAGTSLAKEKVMKKVQTALIVLGCFSFMLGCSGSSGDGVVQGRSDRVVLDVRCEADADCPTGFECESETEHGAATSYCKSHGGSSSSVGTSSGGSTGGACPSGFEQELEHGGTFCKPHGGEKGEKSEADGGTSNSGATCTSNADCAPGFECEIENEHGATTSVCKPHG
jgi:hypothetical protein